MGFAEPHVPRFDPIQAAAYPSVRRQGEVLQERPAFVSTEELFDLTVRLDRVVLSCQQDHVIERQALPNDLIDSLQGRFDVAETTVEAAMTLEEVDVRAVAQRLRHPAEDRVVRLLVHVDKEVRSAGVELRDESHELVGQPVCRDDVREVHSGSGELGPDEGARLLGRPPRVTRAPV